MYNICEARFASTVDFYKNKVIESSQGVSLYILSVTVHNFQKYIVFLSQKIDFVLAKTV